MTAADAVLADRVHLEAGTLYAEPSIEDEALGATGHDVVRFRARNVFFGGVQAVQRDLGTGALRGGGDPRRGGAAVAA